VKKKPRARLKSSKNPSNTIDDIAAAAGVSTATVSRFFNAPAMLKAKTAMRVQEAVSRTGYVPNSLASELASSRSRMVAAVVPVISQSIFNSTIQALSDSLADNGYSVMLGLTGESDAYLQRQLRAIVGRRPDGIILTGRLVDEGARKLLIDAAIPTIETWDLPKNPIDLVVGISHERVGRSVARHVLKTGRRRSLLITATGARAQARRASFTRAMRAGGAPEPSVATFSGATTFGQGRTAVADHLTAGSTPEVIVCSSDMCAHGALHELQRRGVRIPDDIAVIGFGDLDFAAQLTPALTTVKIDGAAIGKQAVQFLMQRARGAKIDRPVVDIGFSLLVRDSG
jgi:LacI family gluconate utilization system Gnt-I transcriptional repressor